MMKARCEQLPKRRKIQRLIRITSNVLKAQTYDRFVERLPEGCLFDRVKHVGGRQVSACNGENEHLPCLDGKPLDEAIVSRAGAEVDLKNGFVTGEIVEVESLERARIDRIDLRCLEPV